MVTVLRTARLIDYLYFVERKIPKIIKAAPRMWKFANLSPNKKIAIRELKTGIKCKNIPERLGPINCIAPIQNIYAPIPAKRTT